MLRVWERCRVVDDAAPVRKIGQRGFCGRVEWVVVLRVWEGRREVGGAVRVGMV